MLLKRPNQTQELLLGLFTLMKELLPGNLLLRKVLLLKVCELIDKNTFPKIREGDILIPHFSHYRQKQLKAEAEAEADAEPEPEAASPILVILLPLLLLPLILLHFSLLPFFLL